MTLQSTLADMYQGRTLVFGHRGARAYAPMNTLPGFELAVAQGADGIELDVQLSKDGAVVVVHDFTVDATTDGSGNVCDMTLAELKALDAGAWFGEAFRGVPIPTLDEVFEAVGGRLFINVEIKSAMQGPTGIEEAVAERIAHFGLQQRVIVSSFDPMVLKRFRPVMPDVPLGFLHYAPIDFTRDLDGLSCEALHPYYELVDAAYVRWCQEHGYWVNTWTVNDPEKAVALRELGVDAIICDNPDGILKALRGE